MAQQQITLANYDDLEGMMYATDTDQPTGEVEFSSYDSTLDPTSTESVALLTSSDTWGSRFQKISQMFKNIRYLLKMLGTTGISSIGNGTVTGAISTLNSGKVARSTTSTSEASVSSGGSSYPNRVMSFIVTNTGGDNKRYVLIVDKTYGFLLQNATDGYTGVWTARAMKYNEYTATTGSTLYNDMYYVDKDVDSSGTIVGITPVDVASNRPAYAIAIGAAKIRIFTTTASTSVKVRVIYSM